MICPACSKEGGPGDYCINCGKELAFPTNWNGWPINEQKEEPKESIDDVIAELLKTEEKNVQNATVPPPIQTPTEPTASAQQTTQAATQTQAQATQTPPYTTMPPPSMQNGYQYPPTPFNNYMGIDALGCVLGGLCFIAPIMGLFLYFIWRDYKPRAAKSALIVSLVSIGLVVLCVLGNVLINILFLLTAMDSVSIGLL